MSHHSRTAYGRVALAGADVVVPDLPGPLGDAVRADAAALPERHRIVEVELDGLDEALRGCPVALSTMDRSYDDDRGYFLAQAAAGRHAARLVETPA